MIKIITAKLTLNNFYEAVCNECNSKFIFDDVEISKVYTENKDKINSTDNKAIICPVCGKLHTFMVYNNDKILSDSFKVESISRERCWDIMTRY